jgi:hypothetical protein
LGFLGSSPAIATVHLHISTGAADQPLDDSHLSINRFGLCAMPAAGTFRPRVTIPAQAFSSEADTGSHQEDASKQRAGAFAFASASTGTGKP